MRPTFLALLLVVASPWQLFAGDRIAPEELLAQMRARDEAIENRKLQFVKSGVVVVNAWWADTTKPTTPAKIRFQRLTTLVVHGAGVTWESIADPLAKFDQSRMSSFNKGSNVDGTLRSMNRGQDPGTRGDVTMNVDPGGYPVDVFQEHGMQAKFVHGLGFGERIKVIESITPVKEGYRVSGTMQIWWEDYTTFELLVDSNYLVRKATIDADVNGHRTRFEVTTEGTRTVGDVAIALKGKFRRTNPDYKHHSKNANDDIQSEFREVSAPLTAEQYKEFATIPEEPLMQVTNRVTKESYVVGEPKSIRKLE